MTVHVEPLALPGGSTDVLRLYAREIAIERTRLLYLGSRTPTLLMLLGGVTSACLVWGKVSSWLLGGWLVWLVLLAVLRLLQVAAFQQADSRRQASRHWRRTFLCGAGASGLTLAFAVIMLVPADAFLQQVLVFGLVAAAILSASVAYAVSLPAFLTFALPGLLPSIVFLLLQPHDLLQGWGVLGLILLVALLVVAGQIHRLVQGALLRRFPDPGAEPAPGTRQCGGRSAQSQARPGGRPAAPGRTRAARRPRRLAAPGGGAHRGAWRDQPGAQPERGAPGHGPGGQRTGVVGLGPGERPGPAFLSRGGLQRRRGRSRGLSQADRKHPPRRPAAHPSRPRRTSQGAQRAVPGGVPRARPGGRLALAGGSWPGHGSRPAGTGEADARHAQRHQRAQAPGRAAATGRDSVRGGQREHRDPRSGLQPAGGQPGLQSHHRLSPRGRGRAQRQPAGEYP